ncbi:MAG: DUF4062 domain-containing protein [Treponema sp.]|jgi:hypothetical protein|nr:DUF4062 domain-containing protein [Treponema sp.]
MKYHIFIGSTLDDLKNERKELPRIIMELGHIPVMADFLDHSAAGTAPLVQKNIEDCDYFVALVAYKYSASDGTVSPLIAEYSAAVKKGIPVISLIIDEKARWKATKKEKDEALIRKLDDLKVRLRKGSYNTWSNTTDLCQKAQTLLIQEMNLNPRSGWVSAEQAVKPLVANEFARLSYENDTLRQQIKMEDNEVITRLREQLKYAIKALALNKVTLSFYYASGENWENTRRFRYLRIYKLLVPELALAKTTAEISRFLGTVLNPDLDKTVRKDYPTPSNTIKKIMTDLSALKLVRCLNNVKTNTGDEVWEITEYGKELYAAYRMRQMEKAFIRKTES